MPPPRSSDHEHLPRPWGGPAIFGWPGPWDPAPIKSHSGSPAARAFALRSGPTAVSAFSLLLRIVLATVAVVVCGAFARIDAGPRALLSHGLHASSAPKVDATTPAPAPAGRWRDHAPRVRDLKAVETDNDDDDRDPRSDAAHHRGPACSALAMPARSLHPVGGEISCDPSSAAAGTGLPRGPPA